MVGRAPALPRILVADAAADGMPGRARADAMLVLLGRVGGSADAGTESAASMAVAGSTGVAVAGGVRAARGVAAACIRADRLRARLNTAVSITAEKRW
jgi:hypothetical protein